MTKVYPTAAASAAAAAGAKQKPCPSNSDGNCVMLTVWKKSLLFNCDGFTVFDGKGNLVFRVDNYYSGNKDEITLMDASGNSLLTIRRKRLSLSDKWLIYDGESTINPMLTVRKQVNLLNTKPLAYASSGCGRGIGLNKYKSNCSVNYEIEGSYTQRCCSVYDTKRRRVAEIKRKESVGGVSFGMDVFRLIVRSEIESPVAMALVILLDQMFGSSKRFSI
ncbi:protein LURP-one-related 8-like [Actinidia eriantha]|uniref:protein LURP-one-related 8-like n=1 Tax=Actinidia eriantha TaxID=165200 RepID=UPI002585C730|nr:protein LURP-one-related 8-like [Actinidia eriantha]